MFNDYPDIMTPTEVAAALGVNVKSIYKMVHNNIIGSKRVGRKILIPKLCLIQFVRSAQYKVHL